MKTISKTMLRVGLAAMALGMAGSAQAAPTFKIDSLTTNNSLAVEVNTTTGDDRGGIAVSGSRVFLSGDSATGVFDHALSVTGTTPTRDAIFSNVRDSTVWTLGSSATTALPFLGGTVTHVIQLDSITGALTGNAIALNGLAPSLSLGNFGTGIFSGYDRVLLHNNAGSVFSIDLTSGALALAGSIANPMHQGAESWAYWGVAEIFGGDQYITYARNSGAIARTSVTSGVTTDIASFPGGFPLGLSDMASFAVSPTENRWYYHYEGSGFAGSRDETLGYASATFTIIPDPVVGGVPEPATWAMMIAGFGMVGAGKRRRVAKVSFA